MDRSRDLIRLLSDGELHSGEAIAGHLGVSRAAVWKSLRKAADRFGLSLHSARGQGYRLSAPLELLDIGTILECLSDPGRRRISRLEILDQTDSTNAHLMREAAAGAPSGTVCLAEHQTAGRGRRGRVWVSPFGANLYLSVLWRYPIAPAQLGGLSLAAGTAVAAALHDTGAEGLALKWPNDVLWGRRKLAGLLLEVAGEAQGPTHLVVGVGVNLHMESAQGEAIDQPWIDLSAVLGGRWYGRNRLAAAVIEALIATLDLFGGEGLNPFLEKWNRFDGFRGESVRVVLGDRVTEGVHAGIAGDGALLLETSDGVRRFQAGEVSLRANGEPRP